MLTNYGELDVVIDAKTGRAKRVRRTVADEVSTPKSNTRGQTGTVATQDRGGSRASRKALAKHVTQGDQEASVQPHSYDSKLEARYHQYVSCLLFTHTIRAAWYHPVTFLLPGGVKYTPDFLLEMRDGALELHECKGSLKMKNVRDSLTRLKLVAGLHPWVTCKVIQRIKGQWVERVVNG